ncbi:efflux RND transporter periplasmic adaptor subunit [Zhouia sp. PK063]|uniref:efflux RND transporter periplasmic adaptor subunit n=1 Tax=Zhouia sp. PK063 TaxID=3373602 RepID=UPI0037B0BA30
MKKNAIYILGYIILFASIIFLYSCNGNATAATAAPAPELPVLTLHKEQASTATSYPATLEGMTDIELRPQVSGILTNIYVDEGAHVRKGQLLFKVDDKPYLEALHNAQANYNAAKATLIQQNLEVEKLKPLVNNSIVSDYQLKAAIAARDIAAANVAQAQAQISSAEINLAYTDIKAPVSGDINRFPKKQGALVSPSDAMALTTISDAHKVHVYFSLGESDFVAFKQTYQKQDTALQNLPPVLLQISGEQMYNHNGKIDMISGKFDQTTGTITLRATFPNPDGFLKSGNTGRVILKLPHAPTVIIPQEATAEVQDKIFVYKVDKNNKVTKQPIVVSGTTGHMYLVEKGLEDGDQIVYKGFGNLQDGMTIQPKKISLQAQTIATN